MKIRNYLLVKRFPFLKMPEAFSYSWTWLDDMPRGWRKAFGIKMCKEIKQALRKNNINDYKIIQIKEKYGELRWYDNNGSEDIYNIIDKYSELSQKTCIECGKPATKMSKGWISPYCDKCAKKIDGKYIDIIM